MRFRFKFTILLAILLVFTPLRALAGDGESLQADQLRKAESYLRAGNAIAAIAPLLNALRSGEGIHTDEGRRARLKLAEAYISSGLYGSARSLAKSLLEDGPPWSTQAYAILVSLEVRRGDMPAMLTALAEYRDKVTSDVDPAVLFEAAKAAFAMRVTDTRALAVFETFGDSVETPKALYFGGVVSLLSRDYKTAYQRFDKLAENLDRQTDVELYDRTQLALGRLFVEAGDPASAERFYTAIPEGSAVYDRALYETAWLYLSQGDLAAASGNLLSLAIEHPFSSLVPRAQVLYGYLLLKQGRYQSAEHAFAAYIGHYSAISERIAAVSSVNDSSLIYDSLFGKVDESITEGDHLAIELRSWLKQNGEVRRSQRLVSRLMKAEEELADLTRNLRKVQTLAEAGLEAFPTLPGEPKRKTALQNRQKNLVKALERLNDAIRPYGERLNAGPAKTYARIERELGEASAMRLNIERMLKQTDEKRRELVSLLRYADSGRWEIWQENGRISPSAVTAPLSLRTNDFDLMFRKLDDTERHLFRALRTTVALEERAIETRFDVLKKQVPGRVLSNLKKEAGLLSSDRGTWIADLADYRRERRQTADSSRHEITRLIRQLAEYRSVIYELSRHALETRGKVAKTELSLIESRIGELLVHARLGNADVAWDARADARARARQVRLQRKEELSRLRELYKELGNAPVPLQVPAPAAVTSSTAQNADTLARRAATYEMSLAKITNVLSRREEASLDLVEKLQDDGHRETEVAKLESAGLLISKPGSSPQLQFAGGAVMLDGKSVGAGESGAFILDSYLQPGWHEIDAALVYVDERGEQHRLSGTFHFTVQRARGYRLSLSPRLLQNGDVLSFRLEREGSR